MPVLIIIFSILALITSILFLRLSLIIEYKENTVAHWKFLFIKKRAFYDKPPKLKKSMSKKEAQKIREEIEKERKKERLKAKRRRMMTPEERKKEPPEIIIALKSAAVLLKHVLIGFRHYLSIKFAKIDIKIGTPDAASTAIAYGAVTQSVNVLMPLLAETKNFAKSKNCKFNVVADFTAEECEMDLKIVLSMRVWQIIKVAVRALTKLTEHSINSLKRKE